MKSGSESQPRYLDRDPYYGIWEKYIPPIDAEVYDNYPNPDEHLVNADTLVVSQIREYRKKGLGDKFRFPARREMVVARDLATHETRVIRFRQKDHQHPGLEISISEAKVLIPRELELRTLSTQLHSRSTSQRLTKVETLGVLDLEIMRYRKLIGGMFGSQTKRRYEVCLKRLERHKKWLERNDVVEVSDNIQWND